MITNWTGAGNLLISGNNASRVFLMNVGANLTLNGVTVTKGYLDGGGGIYNNVGTLLLTNATLSENEAVRGGGIYNNDGTTTLVNSTVSGNTGLIRVGGISNENGTLNLTSVTVAYNSANNGGGVYNLGGTTVNLSNTIIANNTADTASGYVPDFFGAITTASTFNLIGDSTGMSGIMVKRRQSSWRCGKPD
jgi:hypothetical protein